MTSRRDTKAVWGWVLYDWANSAFALSAMALFVPTFFKSYWCAGVDPALSTGRLGIGHTVAGILIAALSPVLGSIAEAGAGRKRLLGGFAVMGAVMVAVLSLVPRGAWLAALVVFLLARVGFSMANLFYDSLLTDVAGPGEMHRVSSKGYAFGYLGCGILGVAHVALVQGHALLGIDKASAVRLVFPTVAAWWMLFSIPMFRNVRERRSAVVPGRSVVGEGLRKALRTGREIARSPNLVLFLVAFWFYNDGVHAVVMMAADFGASIGIPLTGLMVALLATQFVAFPSALVFGRVAAKIGARSTVLVAIVIYIVATSVAAVVLRTQFQFIVLACIVGSAQGAIQALSRSLFAGMTPSDRAAEFFGFYNLVGKFSVVIGPGLVGGMAIAGRHWGLASETASRIGIGSLSILFVIGGVLLSLVRTEGTRR